MATLTRMRKTVEDYMQLPDDLRVELIEGEFFMSPSPSYRHQSIIVNLVRLLIAYVRPRQLGKILCAPFDCILSDENVVQPDVLFVATHNLGKIRERLFGVPDLAIEVLSPYNSERDRIVKRDLYLEFGLPEYWIVDPESKTIEVRTIQAGKWQMHAIFGTNDELNSPALADLRLPVREVFE